MWKLIFALILLFVCSTAEKLSTKECEDLGFRGLAMCSDCNALAEYVKDQELLSDCQKCCAEDSDDSISKVCMRKLVFYPEVVSFIEDEKEKFPSVKIQYLFNAPTKLIMLDDAGQHKEIIKIDNWKREHMLEFLRAKLKPIAAV